MSPAVAGGMRWIKPEGRNVLVLNLEKFTIALPETPKLINPDGIISKNASRGRFNAKQSIQWYRLYLILITKILSGNPD